MFCFLSIDFDVFYLVTSSWRSAVLRTYSFLAPWATICSISYQPFPIRRLVISNMWQVPIVGYLVTKCHRRWWVEPFSNSLMEETGGGATHIHPQVTKETLVLVQWRFISVAGAARSRGGTTHCHTLPNWGCWASLSWLNLKSSKREYLLSFCRHFPTSLAVGTLVGWTEVWGGRCLSFSSCLPGELLWSPVSISPASLFLTCFWHLCLVTIAVELLLVLYLALCLDISFKKYSISGQRCHKHSGQTLRHVAWRLCEGRRPPAGRASGAVCPCVGMWRILGRKVLLNSQKCHRSHALVNWTWWYTPLIPTDRLGYC